MNKIEETNGLVSKIRDEDTQWTDWVHNTHIKRILDRPDDFVLCEQPKFTVHHKPHAPVVPSGGSGTPSLPLPSSKRPSPAPPPSKVPQAPSAPKAKKTIAKTAPFRSSGRIRNPVKKLQIDHTKKTYATYADCLRFSPNACPSPHQYFTRA